MARPASQPNWYNKTAGAAVASQVLPEDTKQVTVFNSDASDDARIFIGDTGTSPPLTSQYLLVLAGQEKEFRDLALFNKSLFYLRNAAADATIVIVAFS